MILAKLHDRTLICPTLRLRILDEHSLAQTKKWQLTKLSATFALSLLCENLLPSLLETSNRASGLNAALEIGRQSLIF